MAATFNQIRKNLTTIYLTTRKSASTNVYKEPLVVILPWMFSKPNQVDKYVKLYQRKGLKNILVVTSPFKEIFFPQFYRRRRTSIAEQLLIQSSQSSWLIVHALSAGTCRLGGLLADMRTIGQEHDKVQRVKQFKSMSKSLFMDSPTEPGFMYKALPYAMFPTKIVKQDESIKEKIGSMIITMASALACKYLCPSSDKEMWTSFRMVEKCRQEYNFNPIAIVSSTSDPVVDYKYCYHLARCLLGHGVDGDWRRSPGEKDVDTDGINELTKECDLSGIKLEILNNSNHVSGWMTHGQLYEQLVDYTINGAVGGVMQSHRDGSANIDTTDKIGGHWSVK